MDPKLAYWTWSLANLALGCGAALVSGVIAIWLFVWFLKKQASNLHKYAETAFKSGYPSTARPIWLEVLSEYDKDHAPTRKRPSAEPPMYPLSSNRRTVAGAEGPGAE